MSSSRTKHVLHHGCVLATVLALTPLLSGCAQVNSVVDTQWLSDIGSHLTGEQSPAEAQLDAVVRSILPAEYSPSYGDGVDRTQPVRRPSTGMGWEGQIRSLAEANGLGVTFEDKMVRIDRIVSRVAVDAAVSESVASPPKAQLTDATIMGMPRDQKTPADAPAPLMTPAEAAVLERAQPVSTVSEPSHSPVLPAVLPSQKPVQEKRGTSSEKNAEVDGEVIPKADLVEATMMGKPSGRDTNPDAPSAPVVSHDAAPVARGHIQSYAARMAQEAAVAAPVEAEEPAKAALVESLVMGKPIGAETVPDAPVSAPVPAAIPEPVVEIAAAPVVLKAEAPAQTVAAENGADRRTVIPPVIAPEPVLPVEPPHAALVDQTVMDVPRGETDAQSGQPAPLMSPQEAAALVQAQERGGALASTPELIEAPVVKIETPSVPASPVASATAEPVVLAHVSGEHPSAAAVETAPAPQLDAIAAMPTATALISASAMVPANAPTSSPKSPTVTLTAEPNPPVAAPASEAHVLVPPAAALVAAPAPMPASPESAPAPAPAHVALAAPQNVVVQAAPAPVGPPAETPSASNASVAAQTAPAAMVPVSDEARVVASAPATAPNMTAAVGTPLRSDSQEGRVASAAGIWKAERGDTLRDVLQKWCDRAGVQLNWSTDFDYPLQASVSINDTFENAVRTMLGGFTNASPQPYGRLHRQGNAGSRLLIIQTRGNRYED